MLILSRRVGESVVIGEDIYLTVLDCKNGQVRLGFDAPETMPINRDEIQRRIHREQQNRDEAPLNCDEHIVDRLISHFKKQQSNVTTH